MILGDMIPEEKVLKILRKSGCDPKRRGWKKRRSLFKGFPDGTCWQHATLTSDELASVSLIRNEPNWLALGGFLREPKAAYAWSKAHPELANSINAYAERMANREYPDCYGVLVGLPLTDARGLVVLDGNHRVAAAMSTRVDVFPVIIGVSNSMMDWAYYHDSKKLRHRLTTLRYQ